MVHGECRCAQTKEGKRMNMNVYEIPLESQIKGENNKMQ